MMPEAMNTPTRLSAPLPFGAQWCSISQTMKGAAKTAVAFSDTATPTSSRLAWNLWCTAASRPRDTRPTMTDSLCMPPIRCRSITGFATPSHNAKAGSPPMARARRGIAHAMAANPSTEMTL